MEKKDIKGTVSHVVSEKRKTPQNAVLYLFGGGIFFLQIRVIWCCADRSQKCQCGGVGFLSILWHRSTGWWKRCRAPIAYMKRF